MDLAHAHLIALAQHRAPAAYSTRLLEFVDAVVSRATAAYDAKPELPASRLEPVDEALAQACAELEREADLLSRRVVDLRADARASLEESLAAIDASEAQHKVTRTPLPVITPGLKINLDATKSLVKHVSEQVVELSARLPATLDRAERTIAAVTESRVLKGNDDGGAAQPTQARVEDPVLTKSRQALAALEERNKRQRVGGGGGGAGGGGGGEGDGAGTTEEL